MAKDIVGLLLARRLIKTREDPASGGAALHVVWTRNPCPAIPRCVASVDGIDEMNLPRGCGGRCRWEHAP